MKPIKTHAELQYEALFIETNDHMSELLKGQRLEGERFDQFAKLYFIGRMLKFYNGFQYNRVNVDAFLEFFKTSFCEIVEYINNATINTITVKPEELDRYITIVSKYMKMPNTANFWLLYGDNFHIAEDCMPQSFDSGSLQVLIECLVNPQVNSGDIAGNPDIFDFMDERSMDIYNELYPNLFN